MSQLSLPRAKAIVRPSGDQAEWRLLRGLSDVDSHMVDAIEDVATWLTVEAKATSDLLVGGELAAANERVHSARAQVHPMRERIAEAML